MSTRLSVLPQTSKARIFSPVMHMFLYTRDCFAYGIWDPSFLLYGLKFSHI